MSEAVNKYELGEVENISPRQIMLQKAMNHKGFLFGLFILSLFTLMAIFAPLIAPSDPFSQSLTDRLTQPIWSDAGTWEYALGSDQLGRDYLSRLIYGVRLSLFIGFTAMLISGIIGTTLGVVAGYFGGRIDMLITFIITTRLSMPIVLIALAVAAVLGSSLKIVIIILGLLLWDRFAVVARSSTIQIRNADYLLAAKAMGCPTWRILLSEVLPNIADAIIVVATLEMAHAILLEASLSFLGLGVQPPLPSWGLMIAKKEYLLEVNL